MKGKKFNNTTKLTYLATGERGIIMKIYQEGYKFEMSASSFGQSNHGCTNWSEYTRQGNAWVCTAVINCTHSCHCGTVWDEVGRVMTDETADIWLSANSWEVA